MRTVKAGKAMIAPWGDDESPIPTTPHLDLKCPTCKQYSGLHHRDVHILDPKHEDAKVGTRTSVYRSASGVMTVEQPVAVRQSYEDISHLNISSRRGSIVIVFDCENCSTPYTLTIEQHKGQTYIAQQNIHDVFVEQRIRDGLGSDDDVAYLAARTLKGER
jgi:hypothetical protein